MLHPQYYVEKAKYDALIARKMSRQGDYNGITRYKKSLFLQGK